jgi:polar amino acid transport system permease protein
MINAAEFFQWLNAHYGVYDAFEWHTFVRGIAMTFVLSATSIAGSVVLGAIGAFFQRSHLRGLRLCADAYVWIFRNTPPLVQLYFFYFALSPFLTHLAGAPTPLLGNIGWAVVSLILFAGAFNIEVFRSGIKAVPHSMFKAASSLGMSHLQTFRKIVMPLALRICRR